ncbi:MAG: DUF883 family protein [Luteolibacter sp.]|jgi:ElaB/YqjD/DUF883 family membrane-anchored ribosome-binding protein
MKTSFQTPQSNVPEAGGVGHPSIAQAANELRAAAGEKAREFVQVAESKANELRERASARAQDLKESASQHWHDTRERAHDIHVSAEDYIREHPTRCVLGALAIGFLAGLIVRR